MRGFAGGGRITERSVAAEGLRWPVSMLVTAPYHDVTGAVIGAAIEVHRQLGPGLLESSYLTCLEFELSERGLRFDAQRAIPIVYKRITLQTAYRIDLIVEDLIVVEVKSVERLLSVHEAQLLTYLRLANSPAGLLINFNVPKLLDGLKRIINSRHIGLYAAPAGGDESG